ncbi:hypothetical protein [Butyrivibrio sp. X503]|uniref:hypothetical protein n=1 Tax=Butyrivibrio sp. X503 TaxID=2364878 RepID=UPI0018F60B6F|nr:hypothetical protein [Butyrivibrio sp. X503]
MKISDTKAFGKAIRDRRKKLGYTQKYIANLLGLDVVLNERGYYFVSKKSYDFHKNES